jgi:MFS family permease
VRAFRLILLMATVKVLAMLPYATYPALVPQFIQLWGLTNAEAGWIGGIFYFGYMLAVPVLAGATDRVDARLVLAGGCLVSALANFAFAAFADSFAEALLWRALSGVGLAGVYMPGLRALTDRLGPGDQSRAVVFFTTSYSIGVTVSFLLAGAAYDLSGWPLAFALGGIGPLLSFALVCALLKPHAPQAPSGRAMLDFRPVFRNREAMAYILAYGAHCFELMAWRGWIAAFLVFAAAKGGEASAAGITAWVAALSIVVVPASLLGNEMALRFGRRRVILAVMFASAAVALVTGATATAGQGFGLLLALCFLYAMTIAGDSGAITAGTVMAAKPSDKGATLAVHATVGFGFSFLGPLAVGLALDAAGGADAFGWGLAYGVMAAGALLGPLVLFTAGRRR